MLTSCSPPHATVCTMERMTCSSRIARSARRATARTMALKTDSQDLLRVGSKFKRVYRIPEAASFPTYLQELLVERANQYDLPLGASLRPNGSKNELILEVPRVTLMDLYIYPTSRLKVDYAPDSVSFYAMDTSLKGSHHIEALNLNDRFELDLVVNIKVQDDLLACHADFKLTVDVPFPFSVTPNSVLEAAGNAAIKNVLAQLMDVLARSMVKDHKLWLQESASESESEQEAPVLAAHL